MFFRYQFLSIFTIVSMFAVVSTVRSDNSPVREVIEITAENFEKEVLKSELPVVFNVYATWCPPCQMMKPIFAELAVEFEGRLKFVKMNGDSQKGLADQLCVDCYPSFVFFDQGDNLGTLQGGGPREEFKKFLEEFLIALAEEKASSKDC